MERLRGFGRRFRFPWRTARRIRSDVDDELAFHLAAKTEALMSKGLSRDAAHAEALRQFGDMDSARRKLVQEDRRGERRSMMLRMLDDLARDMRFAGRSLVRTPAFSLVAVVVLAIGIGVLSMMLNLISLFAFPPALVENPQSLRAVYSRDLDRPGNWPSFSFAEYEAMRAGTSVLSGLSAYEIDTVGIVSGELTERVLAAFVSADYFETLGVPLNRGRSFTLAEEAGDEPASVVISHELWVSRGSNPDILGSTLIVGGEPLVVVGIAPARFTGTVRLLAPQVWLPVAFLSQPGLQEAGVGLRGLGSRNLMLVGRLASGYGDENLAGELAALAARTARAGLGPDATSYTYIATSVPRMSVSNAPEDNTWLVFPIAILLAMGSVVLMIGCLNLANMCLARGVGRRAEMAIRRSLGSGRPRLIRQLLTEGLLLSIIGGIVGFFGALVVTRWLARNAESLAPSGLNLLVDVRLDFTVALATAGICVLATLLFALGPAWRITGRPDMAGLKLNAGTGGLHARPGTRRLAAPRNLMIVAQVALSLVMLVAGGLFLRASATASGKTPGISVESSLVAEVDPGLAGNDEPRSRELLSRLLERLRTLPGIEGAASTSLVPFTGTSRNRTVQRAGSGPGDEFVPSVLYAVSDGYFDSLRMPLLQGRDFTAAEARFADGPPVAIIDETLARRLFSDQSAIGRFVQFPPRPNTEPVWMEVVGVAAGKLHGLRDTSPSPHIYRPAGQAFQSNVYVHLALEPGIDDPESMLGAVRTAIRSIDSDLSIMQLSTLRDLFDRNPNLWIVRFGGTLFMWLGLTALFLALVGVYGVTAFLISQRMREFGVRMALGATRQRLTRQILREYTRTGLLGLVVGLALAIAIGRLLGSMLFEVSSADPLVLAVSAAILGSTATLAAYLPVRRASRIEPTAALRYE